MVSEAKIGDRPYKRRLKSNGIIDIAIEELLKKSNFDRDALKIRCNVNSYIPMVEKAVGDTVKYTVASVVNSGNLRIVITDENNKIIYDVPIDTTHYIELNTISGHIYYLKLVGESANIVVTITRNE